MADGATTDDQSNVFISERANAAGRLLVITVIFLAVIKPSAISIVVLPLSRITVIPSWIIFDCRLRYSAFWRTGELKSLFKPNFLGLGFTITGHYFRRTAMKARNHAFLFEKAQIGTDCRFRGSKYSRRS